MSHSFGSDYFVTCPYDKSHRLLAHRLPKHIWKCKPRYMESTAAIVAATNRTRVAEVNQEVPIISNTAEKTDENWDLGPFVYWHKENEDVPTIVKNTDENWDLGPFIYWHKRSPKHSQINTAAISTDSTVNDAEASGDENWDLGPFIYWHNK